MREKVDFLDAELEILQEERQETLAELPNQVSQLTEQLQAAQKAQKSLEEEVQAMVVDRESATKHWEDTTAKVPRPFFVGFWEVGIPCAMIFSFSIVHALTPRPPATAASGPCRESGG